MKLAVIVSVVAQFSFMGCTDNSTASFFPSDVNGVTPGGVQYSGRKCTFRYAGTERYSVVLVAQGRVITSSSTEATGFGVRLDRKENIDVLFGKSVVVVGNKTETVRNGPTAESTIDSLEATMDKLFSPKPGSTIHSDE